MDKFTALVPCYDGVEKNSFGRRISYRIFYGVQYPPLRKKMVYNLSADNQETVSNDFQTKSFTRYTPLFLPVLDALLESDSISEVVLLGDELIIRLALEYSGRKPNVKILDRRGSLGLNLFDSNGNYDLTKHVFVCMPDVPLITAGDVDKLILSYLGNSDLRCDDIVAGFVPRILYDRVSDVEKKFIRLRKDITEKERQEFQVNNGFLIRLSSLTPEIIDRVYYNRKLSLIPQQLMSSFTDPGRMIRIKAYTELVLRRATLDSIAKRVSDYFQARVRLVLNDVVNFAIDGDSLEDIIKLSRFFR